MLSSGKLFITADIHVFHNNMIGDGTFMTNQRKEFKTLKSWEEYFVDTFNNVVSDKDTTIILGDVALQTSREDAYAFLRRLNGAIILVKGNHDSSSLIKYINNNNYEVRKGVNKFKTHDVGFILKRDAKVYHLTHYPMQLGSFKSNLRNMCGHIHQARVSSPNSINIGLDSPEINPEKFGQPVLFEEAQRCLENKLEKFLFERDLKND